MGYVKEQVGGQEVEDDGDRRGACFLLGSSLQDVKNSSLDLLSKCLCY